MTAGLQDVIKTFVAAKDAYDRAGDWVDEEDEDAYLAAEHAIILYPCQSMEEVRLKAQFFLDQCGPNDTLQNCSDESGPMLNRFLRSLLGEVQQP